MLTAKDFVIIAPYRSRLDHLLAFVPHIESVLHDQMFRVLVVEQIGSKPFNRGALLNAGYKLVASTAAWMVFHDVDMLPIDSNCNYG
jgi:hypothetical protein